MDLSLRFQVETHIFVNGSCEMGNEHPEVSISIAEQLEHDEINL